MKKWQRNQKGVVGWGHQKGGWKSKECEEERVKVERANFVDCKCETEKKIGCTKCSGILYQTSSPMRTCGRPNCLSQEKKNALLNAYYGRPYSFRQLAEMFGVSRMTVWRAVQGEHYGCGV